jgi:hypothetical protein
LTDEVVIADNTDRIEKYIWKQIGKQSLREMATSLGVTPEEVMRVKRDMVDSVDDLTVQVQRLKLIKQLQDVADDVKSKLSEVGDERNYAGIANAFTSASKALLVELNRTAKQNDEAVNALNNLRVRELVSLMYEVIDGGVPIVAERYQIDTDEVFTIFNDVLARAAARRDIA